MTTKEKAEELFNKFNKGEYLFFQVDKNGAKEAAIIAIDEVLKYIGSKGNGYYTLSIELKNEYDYWEAVKSEVECL